MSKKTKNRTKRKTKKGKSKNKDEAIHIRLALYVFNSRKKTKKNKKRNKLSKSIRIINGYNILIDINDPLLDGYIEDNIFPGNFDAANSAGIIVPQRYFPQFDIALKTNNFLEGEKVTSGNIVGNVENWNNKIELLK